MNNTYLYDCFSSTQVLSLKIIRNKQTGESTGYGFLEFVSHAAAQMALQNYNGVHILNAENFYRRNCFFSSNLRPIILLSFIMQSLVPD